MPPQTNPLPESSFFILLSLSAGPRHGYAILKAVEEISAGRVALSVSTLYTALARLQEQGLIERSDDGSSEPAPGLPRKVYRLSQSGAGALNDEALRLEAMLKAYRRRQDAQPT